MGSFYTTCSVSHMVLTNQKTSIQLLVPNYSTDLKEHLGMIVSNDGCQGFFAVFGFPIHGRYYDYGGLEDIQRDKNVEMLEDFFNLSIDQIISNVGDDRWHRYSDDKNWKLIGKDGGDIKNQEIFLKLGMTYIRTEVLEQLQSGWEKTGDGYIKDILEKLDVEEGEAPKNERMKSMIDSLKEKKQAVGLSDLEQEKIAELLFDLSEMGWDSLRTYIPSLIKINMFKLLPITTSVFKDEICKQHRFLNKFGWGLCRTLLPSDYGSQQNNYSALLELNSLVSSLIEKDLLDDCVDDLEHYFDKKTGKVDLKEYREDYGSRVPTSVLKKATKILKDNLSK